LDVIPLANKKVKEEQPLQIPDKYHVIAADLSLKRPGFCVLNVERQNGEVKIMDVYTCSVDNKTKVKPRGQLLAEIDTAFSALIMNIHDTVFLVREQSVNNCGGKMAHASTAARTGVSSVVGVMDLVAWRNGKLNWEEFYPVSIKKMLTGNGKAEKSEVAAVLPAYLGEHEYKNDDESDAAAVAVTWLIHHNQIKHIVQEDTPSEPSK
jgi:crossover junction endodeoxyribonuclease RuvC